MAMIRCRVCGEEISDKASKCPHCGYVISGRFCPECGTSINENSNVCVHCGYVLKTKKSKKNIFKPIQMLIVGGLLILIGLIGLFLGTSISYYGDYVSDEYYGGDAYTGMQQASAATARNVSDLGDLVASYYSGIAVIITFTFMVAGGYFISSGIYLLIRKEE